MTTVEIRTKNMYAQLSKTEKLVADYILHNINNVFRFPLAELSKQSGTSQGAWVRFCKSIGFEGMKDLKKSLFLELKESTIDNENKKTNIPFTDIKDHSCYSSIAQSVCSCSIQSIEATLKLFDDSMLSSIVDKILTANTICLFGVGSSGLVANDLYYKLLRIGYPVTFCYDTHMSLSSASTLTKDDFAIFFSNSGETKEIIESLNIAKKNHAAILAITKYGKSRLAASSDYLLYTSSPELDNLSGAMSSRIAQLVICDILFTAIANKDYANVEEKLESTYRIAHSHRYCL